MVSVTFTTNGDNVVGSEYSITATISISEIVVTQTLYIAWLDSSGSELNATSEDIGSGMSGSGMSGQGLSGMSELNTSGPIVSTLAFSKLNLSQAGVYTIRISITDIYGNNVTTQRSYLLIVQCKCIYLSCSCSVRLYNCMV